MNIKKGNLENTEKNGELLYNSIRLPEKWPPDNFELESFDPMPVPYLEHPPEIINIDLGRQLFVDDFLIESTNLKRTYHKPTRIGQNPILTATMEQTRVSSVGFREGGVFFDSREQLFKMFYYVGHKDERSINLATSKDLINWNRPDLGRGTGNMLFPPGKIWNESKRTTAGAVFAIWLDQETEDPLQRYKMISYWGHGRPLPPGNRHHSLHVSSDGINWSDGILAGPANDAHSFFYNPFRKVWVYSLKPQGCKRRCRLYYENNDFLAGWNWENAVPWTGADCLDQPEPENGYPAYPRSGAPCQLYTLHGVAYESIMLGMHEIHRGPENNICEAGNFPKLTDLELGFSRDGFHWHRPDRSGFIRASREEGVWDRAYLHSNPAICVLKDDKLFFPYSGYSGIDAEGTRGMYRGASIGIASLRRDGFASMNSSEFAGYLITRPLKFSGKYLFVNADLSRGCLRVEVLDEAGSPIAPFTMQNCIAFTGDSTLQAMAWKDSADLSSLREQTVRFRFELTRGSLYAFWVSNDMNGCSNGYLAGGGPGYTGIRDSIGRVALKQTC